MTKTNTEVKMFTIYRFILIEKNGFIKAIPTLEKMSMNRQLKGWVDIRDCKFVSGGEELVVTGDNKNVIQIDVSKIRKAQMRADYETATYYMRGEGSSLKLYRLDQGVNPKDMSTKDILRPLYGDDKDIDAVDMSGFLRFGGTVGCQITTSGSEKVHISTLLCNNDADKVHTYLDEITYGAITPYVGKIMPIDVAAKLASRLGNWMAVKEEGPEVSCYAIYFGTFAESFDNGLDGQSYTTLVKPGQAVQNRAYLFKTVSHGLTDTQMQTHIKHLDAKPIVFVRSEITDDLNKEIREAVAKKGNGTRFKNRVVVICNSKDDNVQYLGDMNALKTDYDFLRISRLNVVKLFKDDDKGVASLSSQVLTKCLMNDEKAAVKLFREQHKKNLEEAFAFKPIKASVESLRDNGRWINALLNIDPDAVKKYGWLFKRLVNQVLMGDGEALNRFHISVPGAYKLLAGDFGAFFGVKLLNPGEMFSRDLPEVKSFSAIKFPAKNGLEYGNYRNIGLKEVANRVAKHVNNGKLNKDEGNCLIDMFSNLKTGIVVFSAMPIVKQLHAGMDFDGDEIMLFDTEFVGLKRKPIAVKVKQPEGHDSKMIRFDYNIMAEAYAEKLTFDNASVGAVTNALEELQYAEFEARRSTDKAKKICKWFGKKVLPIFKDFAEQYNFQPIDNLEKYEPVLHVDGEENGVQYINVDFGEVVKTIRQIISVPVTEENMLNFLHDWNSGIDRWFQEVTLDAFKKFFPVLFPKDLLGISGKKPEFCVIADWKANKAELVSGGTNGIRGELKAAMAADSVAIATKTIKQMQLGELPVEVEEQAKSLYKSYKDKASLKVLLKQVVEAGRVYSRTKDSDLYQAIMAGIENQVRLLMFDDKYCKTARAAIVLGASILTNYKDTVEPKIGTMMLREELIQLITHYSDNADEFAELMQELDESAVYDASKMTIRMQLDDNLLDDIEKKLHQEGTTVHMTADKNGNVLFGYNEASFLKGAYIDSGYRKGNPMTLLGRILDGRDAEVGATYRLYNKKDDTKDTLLVTLCNVRKANK